MHQTVRDPDETAQRALLHDIDGDAETWVFGYGSLMWQPGFDYLERQPALLYGYHRSFCIYSEYYRGTKERRGLVLGLDRGGCCRGIGFRLPRDTAHDILDYLWDREMVTSVYAPKIVRLHLAGRRVSGRTFVASPGHFQYAGRLPNEQIIAMIRQGVGKTGTNIAYLEATVAHLDTLGIADDPLHRLVRQVQGSAASESVTR